MFEANLQMYEYLISDEGGFSWQLTTPNVKFHWRLDGRFLNQMEATEADRDYQRPEMA